MNQNEAEDLRWPTAERAKRNVADRMLIALAMTTMLGACTMGPDFKAPTAPTAASVTVQPLPQSTDATPVPGGEAQHFAPGSVVSGHWWSAYSSPQLDRLVDEAFAASPTVTSAQAALRAAQQGVIAQRGGLFPTISGGLQAERQKVNGESLGLPPGSNVLYNLYNASVNLSYNFDVFGGVRRGIEAQTAERDAQREQLQATYQTLAANVVTAAVLEASMQAQIDATHELIASAQHEVDLSRKQFELGGAARSDVLSTESNLASLQAMLPPQQQKLAMARSQLAVYLGKVPSEYGEATFDLTSLQLPKDIPVMVPSDIVRQRPDIRGAEAQLHEASAQIGVATANMFPQIALTGSFGDSGYTLSSLMRSSVFSLAGSLTQPIFEGGTLNAKRHAAIAQYDEALAQYRQTVLLAFKNVADALRALDNDAQTLAAQYQAQTTAAGSLHLIEQRVEMGDATGFDLLIAEQQYEKSRIDYVQALAARYQDTAALFLALGGDWNRADDVAQR